MYIYNTLTTLLPFLPKIDQNDYLSNLPHDVLSLIAHQLPMNNVRALHTVSLEIQPVTQQIINAKIQTILEDAILGNEKLFYFIEKSNAQALYSENRIQTLRDAFCSVFEENLSIRNFTAIENNFLDFGDCDYKLATQLFKIVHEDSDYPCECNYKKESLQKRFFLTMDMLAKNQMNPKKMEINIHGFSLDQKKILVSLLKALKNSYLSEISLKYWEWNVTDLNKILTVIKKNEKIQTLIVREAYDMWKWNFKPHGIFYKMYDDHILELNTVITNQLGISNVIQNRNKWTYLR